MVERTVESLYRRVAHLLKGRRSLIEALREPSQWLPNDLPEL
jgi:hypothetical protein